jgi:hypothetical protein
MNRLLLTLLALLTGLVTQAAPAQAALRSPGETEIGAVAVSGGTVRLTAVVARAHVGAPLIAASWIGGPPVHATTGAPPLETVHIGIDRARE